MKIPFSKLTKAEKQHIKETTTNGTLAEFKRNAAAQALMRRDKNHIEPCWECRSIAKKLGLDI